MLGLGLAARHIERGAAHTDLWSPARSTSCTTAAGCPESCLRPVARIDPAHIYLEVEPRDRTPPRPASSQRCSCRPLTWRSWAPLVAPNGGRSSLASEAHEPAASPPSRRVRAVRWAGIHLVAKELLPHRPSLDPRTRRPSPLVATGSCCPLGVSCSRSPGRAPTKYGWPALRGCAGRRTNSDPRTPIVSPVGGGSCCPCSGSDYPPTSLKIH